MSILGISRVLGGFISVPLIGIFAANLFSFVLWAWRAPSIEVLSASGVLTMYAYVFAVGIAALAVARRFAVWSILAWLAIGAICALPACVSDIWSWSAVSGGTLLNVEFVFRYLALYLFAGSVAGGIFWMVAVVGNHTLTSGSHRG